MSNEENIGLNDKLVSSKFGQIYLVDGSWDDDESLYYNNKGYAVYNSTAGTVTYYKSEATLTPKVAHEEGSEYGYTNYESNKWGETSSCESVILKITVNSDLTNLLGTDIQVAIDGKYYDLKKLDNELELYMGVNHRIQIFWGPDYTETFRVIAKR